MMNIKVDRAEALRYMGFKGIPDSSVEALYKKALSIVNENAVPKSFYASFSMTESRDKVQIAGIEFLSKSLAKHLNSCEELFLLGCTLGTGIDMQIRRLAYTDTALSAAVQAVSAAYIESYADECEEPIRKYAAEKKLYLRPRFSPGYGDLPLASQKDFFDLIDLKKRIGVTLTENYMMIPSKSITAFIGLSSDESKCHIEKCMNCSNKNCPFRKD